MITDRLASGSPARAYRGCRICTRRTGVVPPLVPRRSETGATHGCMHAQEVATGGQRREGSEPSPETPLAPAHRVFMRMWGVAALAHLAANPDYGNVVRPATLVGFA